MIPPRLSLAFTILALLGSSVATPQPDTALSSSHQHLPRHHDTRSNTFSLGHHKKMARVQRGTAKNERRTLDSAVGKRRQLRRSEGATVKCSSEITYSLCDGEECTEMGDVAAGTICKDGAITWDKSDEDGSSASSTSAPASSTKAVAANYAKSSSSSALSSSSSARAHSVKKPASTTFRSLSTSSTPSPTTASSSSTSSARVRNEAVKSKSSWSSLSTTPAARSSSTSYKALNPSPTTTSRAQTTTQAPSTTKSWAETTSAKSSASPSSAPAASSSSPSGGSSSGETFSGGEATFYYQEGATGACGSAHSDSDLIVAVNPSQYSSSICGKSVHISNDDNGKSVTATVADLCPGCGSNSLDLSQGAFDSIGEESTGTLSISWYFTD